MKIKCKFVKENWVACDMMNKATQEKRPGLNNGMLMNFKTGEVKDIPILRSGEFVKKGIVLNFCPWCGVSLKRLYKEESV
jgi:hypothetical protein